MEDQIKLGRYEPPYATFQSAQYLGVIRISAFHQTHEKNK